MSRVQVISPDGVRGTVDEADVASLPEGARVISSKELAQQAVDERYDALPTGRKVLGGVTAAASLINPLAIGANIDAPPSIAEYGAGVRQGLTAGMFDAGMRAASDAVGGKAAGDRYAEQRSQEQEASPTAGAIGGLTGMVAGSAIGAGAGAARALPSAALATAGGAIEHGTAKTLGGLAAKGVLGKAAAQGASMAVRGAVEGAAYSGVEQAASDVLHDDPVTGEKLYAAAGHGALLGGSLGGVLGFGGSLAGSAVQGIGRAGTSRMLAQGGVPALPEAMATSDAVRGPHDAHVRFIDADAGLREKAPKAESVFSFSEDRGPMQLKGGSRGALKSEDALTLRRNISVDPETSRERAVQLKRGLFGTDEAVAAEGTTARARQGGSVSIDPNAGLAGGLDEARDVFQKGRARTVDFGAGGFGDLKPVDTSAGPIQAGRGMSFEPGAPHELPAPGAPRGIIGALADPSNAARAEAYDQAWRSVGGGFGLQSTRYAKEAARYFPNGTRDLGEVALRHGLIDTGPVAASPWSAAWQAAKSGTPADIAPRAAAAGDAVADKLGAITDASGARVALSDVVSAIKEARGPYDRIAGNEHVVSAIDNYERSLLEKLGGSRDGAASVQSLLEQRKGLDEIVYRETKTLDPGRRVQALRDVRRNIEDVIANALDGASGKVPGAQRVEYQTLKKDYQALRILTEAAEDSAARSAKSATLGIGEKVALGSALASGHLAAAPVLAVGGKMIRERGNAAAAAFLSRAADQGTFERLVRDFNERIKGSAAGVLREAPAGERAGVASKATQRDAASGREQARRDSASQQAKATAIVKWVGDHNANPAATLDQIEEAAALVGRSAGPRAAESYTASTVRAVNFIAGHIPIKERRDPLDPRSTPPLMKDEAERLVRATKYAAHPQAIFTDFERGIITPEGLRAAKTLAPESFAEFQLKLQEHVEARMLSNKPFTQVQRLRIDKLLGYPAGADLKPKAIARLQANLMPAEEPPPAGPSGGGGPAPNPPLGMKIQQSGFDSIEARLAG